LDLNDLNDFTILQFKILNQSSLNQTNKQSFQPTTLQSNNKKQTTNKQQKSNKQTTHLIT